ncbi:MAG: hypothetical protein Q9177_006089, partial [Variospora cf. flavescens]
TGTVIPLFSIGSTGSHTIIPGIVSLATHIDTSVADSSAIVISQLCLYISKRSVVAQKPEYPTAVSPRRLGGAISQWAVPSIPSYCQHTTSSSRIPDFVNATPAIADQLFAILEPPDVSPACLPIVQPGHGEPRASKSSPAAEQPFEPAKSTVPKFIASISWYTGVRPYSCGLCEDTFARSDILKRHFQKCSVRRGNPSGASHLTHSKNSKKSKGTPVEQLTIPLNPLNNPGPASSAPSTRNIQQASYRASPTPTLQSPLDLQGMSNLGLSTAQYQEDLQSFSNRASRANSTKRSSTGMTASSRTTSGPSSIAGPDSAFSYSNGQVTPDSLTTSGAATPYSIHHESRLPFSPDGSYHAANGSSLDLSSMSRPHSGPSYPSGHHPHIIGSANGSRHDLDALFSSNAPDDFNQHYPTHHHDETHHNIKSEPDYSDVHYTMTGSYPMT